MKYDYWTMVRLFETDRGFLACLNESQQFRVFNNLEPMPALTYRVADLNITPLTDQCGKAYSASDGTIVLEYVDRI